HNVAAGTAATDAANVGQVSAQVTQALQTAKTYTDASAQQTLNSANAYTNQAIANYDANSGIGALRQQINDQFTQINKKINDQG
ncbi:hypothetical protein M1747_23355, partial [Salmonella enterica subsp. enterica serovar Oranienburg]|nr:hypothetical protein [Salmonella enterica subsp. enterica serovar Oranienburg]